MIKDKGLLPAIRVGRPWLLIGLSFIIYHLSFNPAGAQNVHFGVKGGVELTHMEFSGDALRKSNRTGFYIGPQLKFQLPVVGLGIDGSLLYSQRELKVEGESIRQQSLLLPVHARYGVGIGDELGVFLCAGPQFSFNVGHDVFYWIDEEFGNNQFSLQNTTLSMNFGGGLMFAGHLEASVFYNVPLGKTADFTWDKLGSELYHHEWSRDKSNTNAWHISLTYFF